MEESPNFLNNSETQTPPAIASGGPPHKSFSHWLMASLAIIAVVGYFVASYALALWPFGDLITPLPPMSPPVDLDDFENSSNREQVPISDEYNNTR